jgi:putative Mn2+ efflux pump MntP
MPESLDGVWLQAGQWLTIGTIALALGMDALSLGIGVGMSGLRRRQMLGLSGLDGLFHVLCPAFGIVIGGWLSQQMGSMAVLLGGLLLFLWGVQMFISGARGEAQSLPPHRGASLGVLVLLALGVSVDSLSIGFSMGLFSADILLSLAAFGLCGFGMSLVGLVVGRHAGRYLGMAGEIVGGLILMMFGVILLL